MLPVLVPVSHITGMRPKAAVADKLKLLSFHEYNRDRSENRFMTFLLYTLSAQVSTMLGGIIQIQNKEKTEKY